MNNQTSCWRARLLLPRLRSCMLSVCFRSNTATSLYTSSVHPLLQCPYWAHVAHPHCVFRVIVKIIYDIKCYSIHDSRKFFRWSMIDKLLKFSAYQKIICHRRSIKFCHKLSPMSTNGAQSRVTIGTHNGSFHCDETLACSMLKLLPRWAMCLFL